MASIFGKLQPELLKSAPKVFAAQFAKKILNRHMLNCYTNRCHRMDSAQYAKACNSKVRKLSSWCYKLL